MRTAARPPLWRSTFLIILFGLLFAGLALRAYFVQIAGSTFYVRQGEARYLRTLEMPATRGRILDRNGDALALSTPESSIAIVPRDFSADAAQRAALAQTLRITTEDLQSRLKLEQNFVWLRRLINDDVARQTLALGLRGVISVVEHKRRYPGGETSAQVVGLTSTDGRGIEGAELAFDRELSGRDGVRRVVQDRLGRVVEAVDDVVPVQHGKDVTLSIDAKVQAHSHRLLADLVTQTRAAAGASVVLDARTGEVLAMTGHPTYTPDDRSALNGSGMRNRVIADLFEPGTTMLPFTAALAMESGRVTADTVIQTSPGTLTLTGATIRDAMSNGAISVAEVVRRASNVGAVKLAMQMQPREMWEIYTQMGFGQRPEIPFSGAASGRLRDYRTWRPIEQATMGYGYGLSTSLLQLARAYTTFANAGRLAPLSLTKTETDATGTPVLSEATASSIRTILAGAGGPGSAPLRLEGRGVFGGMKGASAKLENGSYSPSKRLHVLVGLAPIHHPQVVVAVMLDEPQVGTIRPDTLHLFCEDLARAALQGKGDPVVPPKLPRPLYDQPPSERDRF